MANNRGAGGVVAGGAGSDLAESSSFFKFDDDCSRQLKKSARARSTSMRLLFVEVKIASKFLDKSEKQ